MVFLKKTRDNLLILVGDNIIVYNFEDLSERKIKIQEPKVEEPNRKSLDELLKPENRRITSVSLSENDEYLAVTLQNRQLVLYDNKFNVIKNIMTKRAVSKTTFTHEKHLLLADKTGDVYLCKFNVEEQPDLILGHLSMLLDVVVSRCGKYVITCDRDEKIRVSCYPNAYNIVSYCLGHKEFVSNLSISNNILVSASGDGTIRFWNYLTGEQIGIVNTNDHIKDETVVEKFCKEMDDEKVDISAVPIVDMQVFQNIVAVTILGFNAIQLYCMEINDGSLNVKLIDCLVVSSEIILFSLSEKLFILTEKQLLCYNVSAKGLDEIKSEEISKFSENCKSLLVQNSATNDIQALYKRKFDNVQEYLERKKQRLENMK